MKHKMATNTLDRSLSAQTGHVTAATQPTDSTAGSGQSPLFSKVHNFKSAEQVRALGLYPYFREISSAQDTEVIIDGKKVLMLGSNSYLGLTNHPKVKAAAQQAIEKYGTGCAGSRFLNGTLDIHIKLEQALARLVGKEAALLYSTGFQVNLGVISVMVGRDEYILADKSNHASLNEGCMLSPGELIRFAHNDVAALERRLQKLPVDAGKLIVVDGVFSMEGDIAPLPDICRLARLYNAAVMVDDAHGIGVLGTHGAGTVSHFGLTNEVDLIMGTFSKSFASLGGFIAGDEPVIHYIKHHARALIFSASIPPANAAAALAALQVMREEPERIERINQIGEYMRNSFRQLGFNIGNSQSPIIPVIIGDHYGTMFAWKVLFEKGVFVNPVLEPGVPAGMELLRTSYMATHTDDQLERVLEIFEQVGKQLGMI
jgi:8-amino-7-oxononanoate synthase